MFVIAFAMINVGQVYGHSGRDCPHSYLESSSPAFSPEQLEPEVMPARPVLAEMNCVNASEEYGRALYGIIKCKYERCSSSELSLNISKLFVAQKIIAKCLAADQFPDTIRKVTKETCSLRSLAGYDAPPSEDGNRDSARTEVPSQEGVKAPDVCLLVPLAAAALVCSHIGRLAEHAVYNARREEAVTEAQKKLIEAATGFQMCHVFGVCDNSPSTLKHNVETNEAYLAGILWDNQARAKALIEQANAEFYAFKKEVDGALKSREGLVTAQKDLVDAAYALLRCGRDENCRNYSLFVKKHENHVAAAKKKIEKLLPDKPIIAALLIKQADNKAANFR